MKKPIGYYRLCDLLTMGSVCIAFARIGMALTQHFVLSFLCLLLCGCTGDEAAAPAEETPAKKPAAKKAAAAKKSTAKKATMAKKPAAAKKSTKKAEA